MKNRPRRGLSLPIRDSGARPAGVEPATGGLKVLADPPLVAAGGARTPTKAPFSPLVAAGCAPPTVVKPSSMREPRSRSRSSGQTLEPKCHANRVAALGPRQRPRVPSRAPPRPFYLAVLPNIVLGRTPARTWREWTRRLRRGVGCSTTHRSSRRSSAGGSRRPRIPAFDPARRRTAARSKSL